MVTTITTHVLSKQVENDCLTWVPTLLQGPWRQSLHFSLFLMSLLGGLGTAVHGAPSCCMASL
ncbi:rCG57566, isoform CRA_b [Rattus norvegicus]|uniref:RCG57566, isoform CRA_b n=1 Tax=Rattus norvegicus TaxID=10116 RepID=A6JHV8_RAT|nr:rCG57566, isoform CRA_b [Rattus norvegicus]